MMNLLPPNTTAPSASKRTTSPHSNPGFVLRAKAECKNRSGPFITLVTHERQNLFGTIDINEMHLNPLGEIARDEWFRTAQLRPYVELFEEEFIVMPNHIHGIIWITNTVWLNRRGAACCAQRVGLKTTNNPKKICRAFFCDFHGFDNIKNESITNRIL